MAFLVGFTIPEMGCLGILEILQILMSFLPLSFWAVNFFLVTLFFSWNLVFIASCRVLQWRRDMLSLL
jgi:hypothetical protein